MRNIIWFLLSLTCILFIVVGCSKKQEAPPIFKEVTATTPDAIQQMYSQLTASEMLALWQEHFEECMDSLSSDVDKVTMINNLYDSLTVDIFTDSSDEQIVFLNYTAPRWVNNAKAVFSDQEIFELTMLNKLAPEHLGNLDPGGETKVDCFCHVGNSGYSCKKVTLTIPPSVEYGICEVGGDQCNYNRRGCGFLWMETCNGAHCNF